MTAGKLLYKAAFTLQKKFALISTGIEAGIWYRNSLYLNYFRFGKSDIDVTVVLSSDGNVTTAAANLADKLHLCPLIKEINTYYPFSLRFTPKLINAFELKKDPDLSKIVKSSNNSAADQFTYLLRMYFSNLAQKSFTSRDLEKWNYHFSLVGKPQLSASLKTGMGRAELLSVIASEHPQNIKETIHYASESFLKHTELYDQYVHCKHKEILAMILPQHFCFAETSGEMKDQWIEEIFVSQMSWEIWAMMTQPALFASKGPGQIHLKNIIKALSKNQNARSEELKKIAEDFERFSSNLP